MPHVTVNNNRPLHTRVGNYSVDAKTHFEQYLTVSFSFKRHYSVRTLLHHPAICEGFQLESTTWRAVLSDTCDARQFEGPRLVVEI